MRDSQSVCVKLSLSFVALCLQSVAAIGKVVERQKAVRNLGPGNFVLNSV